MEFPTEWNWKNCWLLIKNISFDHLCLAALESGSRHQILRRESLKQDSTAFKASLLTSEWRQTGGSWVIGRCGAMAPFCVPALGRESCHSSMPMILGRTPRWGTPVNPRPLPINRLHVGKWRVEAPRKSADSTEFCMQEGEVVVVELKG